VLAQDGERWEPEELLHASGAPVLIPEFVGPTLCISAVGAVNQGSTCPLANLKGYAASCLSSAVHAVE
jgi:hypothetical protein